VVTDVASVKEEMVSLLDPMCRDAGCAFVGAHPIAGSEDTGAAAADATLFRDGRCILTPTAASDAKALAAVRALWEGVGMRVEQMDAGMHDRILARVSHAPHVVAYALAAAVGEARVGMHPVSSYAGSGLRDTTRIAGSSATLWRGIALANREGVLEALAEFETRLRLLTELIRRGDEAALEEAFAEARDYRKGLIRS
jgi:prephenate dehydrogenase